MHKACQHLLVPNSFPPKRHLNWLANTLGKTFQVEIDQKRYNHTPGHREGCRRQAEHVPEALMEAENPNTRSFRSCVKVLRPGDGPETIVRVPQQTRNMFGETKHFLSLLKLQYNVTRQGQLATKTSIVFGLTAFDLPRGPCGMAMTFPEKLLLCGDLWINRARLRNETIIFFFADEEYSSSGASQAPAGLEPYLRYEQDTLALTTPGFPRVPYPIWSRLLQGQGTRRAR
ncbi:hypothetical protein BC826DRAFT_971863 [Russula brevipes]|nr:hypothetical protein BC826DRAFT_971863 [Russula brevipes]